MSQHTNTMTSKRRLSPKGSLSMKRSHPQYREHYNKRQTTTAVPASGSCILYTSPTAASILPVLTSLNLTWNPSCLTLTPSATSTSNAVPTTIDLYLSILENTDASYRAVHVWTDVEYAPGNLATQLKPGWWNASSGAGQVQAQFTITPSGSPIWDTTAPSGPLFTIAYNGSYPASTNTAPTYNSSSGPSSESLAPASGGVLGGKLAAAVAIPLLVVFSSLIAYVVWSRWKRKDKTKRFSAVVDQRMSMISQGTWVPPASIRSGRHSTTSSRPGSMVNIAHHSNGSLHGPSSLGGERRSAYLADGRPNSQHSHYGNNGGSGTVTPSPLGGTFPRSSTNPEMRQIDQGNRTSRVSFAGFERPSARRIQSYTDASGKAHSIDGHRESYRSATGSLPGVDAAGKTNTAQELIHSHSSMSFTSALSQPTAVVPSSSRSGLLSDILQENLNLFVIQPPSNVLSTSMSAPALSDLRQAGIAPSQPGHGNLKSHLRSSTSTSYGGRSLKSPTFHRNSTLSSPSLLRHEFSADMGSAGFSSFAEEASMSESTTSNMADGGHHTGRSSTIQFPARAVTAAVGKAEPQVGEQTTAEVGSTTLLLSPSMPKLFTVQTHPDANDQEDPDQALQAYAMATASNNATLAQTGLIDQEPRLSKRSTRTISQRFATSLMGAGKLLKGFGFDSMIGNPLPNNTTLSRDDVTLPVTEGSNTLPPSESSSSPRMLRKWSQDDFQSALSLPPLAFEEDGHVRDMAELEISILATTAAAKRKSAASLLSPKPALPPVD